MTKGEQDKLKNGDTIKVTYTLKPGYTWSDGTTQPIVLTYTVSGLS